MRICSQYTEEDEYNMWQTLAFNDKTSIASRICRAYKHFTETPDTSMKFGYVTESEDLV